MPDPKNTPPSWDEIKAAAGELPDVRVHAPSLCSLRWGASNLVIEHHVYVPGLGPALTQAEADEVARAMMVAGLEAIERQLVERWRAGKPAATTAEQQWRGTRPLVEALADVGADHEPAPGWQARVREAVRGG
jgi:hypothetical protein